MDVKRLAAAAAPADVRRRCATGIFSRAASKLGRAGL